jgi:DNA adenine methylase
MISYIGGKARIGKWIRDYIPTDIETYVEPFSGMFWVYFNMDLSKYPRLHTVVYNDFNRLNANLMECARHYDTLHKELQKYPCQQRDVIETPSEYRQMFNEFQEELFAPDFEVGDLGNFEVASKYTYVLTQVFSGSQPEKAKFTDYKGKYKSKYLIFMDKLTNPTFREHYDRIKFVENMDFQDLIHKYDSPTTYFYTDPPYWKTENYYSNHDFDRDDHERLATSLKSMEGRFGLSYYDFDLLEEWFPKDQYVWEQKDFAKAAAGRKGKKQNMGTELLIMNYGSERHDKTIYDYVEIHETN